MKKIAVLCCALCLLLSGCGENIKDYDRSSEPGKLETIHLDELYQKFQNKETFTLLITQTTCFHCQEMLKELTPYLKNHEVVIYDLVLDKEGLKTQTDYDNEVEKLNEYLSDFSGTPSLYYVEEGKKDDGVVGWGPDKNGKNIIDIDTYDTFVRRHQLDAINK